MRRQHADRAYGGHFKAPALRTCPRCGAEPGKSCIRTLRGVGGVGGYTVRMKKFHRERQQPQDGAP